MTMPGLERPRTGLSGSRLPASRPAALSSAGAHHQGAFLRRLAGPGADEPLTDRTPYPRALLHVATGWS